MSSFFDVADINFFEFLKNKNFCEAVVCKDEKEAKNIFDVASFFGFSAFLLPEFRADFLDDLRSFNEELLEISKGLNNYYLCKKSNKVLIVPLSCAVKFLPKPQLLKNFTLSFGDTLNLQKLKEKLLFSGYDFVDIVEREGEVSFRGDIVDIFSSHYENGIRISLFDNEIESIRFFDIQTQKSFKEELEDIIIYPALFSLTKEEFEKVFKKIKRFR
jgi:transcription-repair coupling factor (superfamily II helicase)